MSSAAEFPLAVLTPVPMIEIGFIAIRTSVALKGGSCSCWNVTTIPSTFSFETIEVKSNVEISALWAAPATLPTLEGHFPGQPVVPAVTILDCVTDLMAQGFKRTFRLQGVKNAKFTSPLLPDQVVTLVGTQVTGGDWSFDLKTKSPEGEPQAIAKLLLAFE